jgi:hypothetical protein
VANEANLTPWKKGQSGNPKGRTPYKGSLTELIRAALRQTHLCGKDLPDGLTAAHILAETMIQHAIKGQAPYMKEVMDRNDGKLPDAQPDKSRDEELAEKLRAKRAKRKTKPE